MAVEVSRKGHYPSKTACAKAHRISPSTLTTRLHKAMSPKELAALHPKLTMCQRGLILQPSDVLYMLELVLSARLKASSRKPTVNDGGSRSSLMSLLSEQPPMRKLKIQRW